MPKLATLGDAMQDNEDSVLDEMTATRKGNTVDVGNINVKGMSGKKWLLIAALAAAAWYIVKKK